MFFAGRNYNPCTRLPLKQLAEKVFYQFLPSRALIKPVNDKQKALEVIQLHENIFKLRPSLAHEELNQVTPRETIAAEMQHEF
jgi:hypothetical protein